MQLMTRTGLGGITATIIQDSISLAGDRVTTFELIYPRFIHSELMTHRQFSRNAASSRAIPVERMLQVIDEQHAAPIHWGKNQTGMQANEELQQPNKIRVQSLWQEAAHYAVQMAKQMHLQGAHKQIVNRITEPYQMMKTVVTSTHWANWYWLRNHDDAQPEIHELARVMYELHEVSKPMLLDANEWHVPYIRRDKTLNAIAYFAGDEMVTLEDAKKVSASCCAQVSYRRLDESLEKAKMVFSRLIDSKPMHASPVEHQCTPVMYRHVDIYDMETWPAGVTHLYANGSLGSGNFLGWIQYRQLLEDHTKY